MTDLLDNADGADVELVPYTFKMRSDDLDALRRLAPRVDRTVSSLIRLAVRKLLEDDYRETAERAS